MASQVMRITLKAYDHELVDSSAKKIIETVKKNGSQVSGPVPLPTKKEVVTILELLTSTRILVNSSSRELIRDLSISSIQHRRQQSLYQGLKCQLVFTLISK